MHLKVVLLAGAGICALSVAPASAQAVHEQTSQAPAPSSNVSAKTSADDQAPAVGEIIVTAQRRAQRINDIGMAITAATGDSLVARNITQVQSLTRIEPSLQFSQSNSGTPVYTIRGFGYFELSLSATPTVSVYQDEIAYTYPSMSKAALLDVQRVEILKGPQGTLYGQNATGGAINFVANRPSDHLEAGFDATYSRFGSVQAEGYISGPLTDTLTARLAGQIQSGGAWQTSDTRDQKLGDKDFKTARLLLDWNPDSRLKVSLNVNGFIDHSENQAAQLEGIRFQSPAYIGPLAPGGLNLASSYIPNPANFNLYPQLIQNLISNPIAPQNDRAADWVDGTRPHNDDQYWQSALRFDYTLSDAFIITSLTNYEYYNQNDYRDIAGVNVINVAGIFRGRVETFSQELRLHGQLLNHNLEWLVGGNYQHDRTNEDDNIGLGTTGSYLTGGSAYSPFNLGSPFENYIARSTVGVRTKSVFGNLEYHLSPKLSAHAGIRYTRSDQNTAGCTTSSSPALQLLQGEPIDACDTALPNGTRGAYITNLNEHNVPWRVGLDYKPSLNNLLYASVSKGYKAGSTPTLGASNYVQLKPVVQESLLSYEVGFKLSLLNRAVQLNGSYFHYDYTNKQILGRTIDPIFGPVQALVNIPKSKVDGAEFSAVVRPTRELTFNGSVTYLDSKVTSSFLNFSSYVASDGLTPPFDQVNFQGESFPFTPKWSFSYGARYEHPLNEHLNGFVEVDGTHQSGTVGIFGADHANAEGP